MTSTAKQNRREENEAVLKQKRQRRAKTNSINKTAKASETRAQILVGEATACRMEGSIYEATGGGSQEVGRQIGNHQTVKHKVPQETTGVQFRLRKIPAWEAADPTKKARWPQARNQPWPQEARIQPRRPQEPRT